MKETKKKDIAVTPAGDFTRVGEVVNGFIKKHSLRQRDCKDSEEGRVIPVDGHEIVPGAAHIVIDRAEGKLYFRVRELPGMPLEEQVDQRDSLLGVFMDYLTQKGIDYK
jgi:hypothetical protein